MVENNANDLALLREVAAKAGKIALKYFKSENEVWMKPGDSPVSKADIEVNNFLRDELLGARPDYGWISEETEDNDERLGKNKIFIVDPIDGTRGFINGLDQWCISVAIVEDATPVAAILECPALGESFSSRIGEISRLNGTGISVSKSANVTSATGSRKINDLISSLPDKKIKVTEFVPSLAYRIAMVANGSIDVAFARPGAHEWDLAAADLILSNAGGALVDLQGEKLGYNRKKLHYGALIASASNLQKSAIKLAKSADILH